MADVAGAAALNLEATRQAAAVAYNDDFLWLAITSLVCIPIISLTRMPKSGHA